MKEILSFIQNKPFISRQVLNIRHMTPPKIKDVIIKNNNILPGFSIGIPINILSYTYTNIHYGYDITTINNIFLLFGLGFISYNYDRTLDAIYSLNNYTSISNERKYLRHVYYYENIELYLSSIILIYGLISSVFTSNELYLPFFLLLNSTIGYKYFKETFGIFKSSYIAICWTLASEILPCVIHDQNYDILNYPLDYVPLGMTLFAYSNIADIDDITEDMLNSIQTLPIIYGGDRIKRLSILVILLANILFAINPHYGDNFVWNTFIEVGNFGYIANEIIINSNTTQVNTTNLKENKFDIAAISIITRFLGI